MQDMLIAIDYDGTYNNAPEMWERIIEIMEFHGHRVICVTSRLDPCENVAEDGRCEVFAGEPVDPVPSCPVFYTSRRAKVEYMSDLDVHVDIWIDDDPEHIIKPW